MKATTFIHIVWVKKDGLEWLPCDVRSSGYDAMARQAELSRMGIPHVATTLQRAATPKETA